MILEKNRKFAFLFLFFLVFNKKSLEIMSHDHLFRKQALLDYKNGFYIVAIIFIGIFFQKG